MGNIINSHKISVIRKKFISSNIIDEDNNIIIGIWNNPNKINTMGNQGICIGNDDEIYELKFACRLLYSNLIEFIFDKNIKLLFFKDSSNKFMFQLNYNKNSFKKEISKNILNKLKKINNLSEDIDLIIDLLDK